MNDFVITKCNSIITSICDWFGSFFGTTKVAGIPVGNAMTSPDITENIEIGNIVTKILKNTIVHVYVYNSKIPNSFTFIGRTATGSPGMVRYMLLRLTVIPLLGNLIKIGRKTP